MGRNIFKIVLLCMAMAAVTVSAQTKQPTPAPGLREAQAPADSGNAIVFVDVKTKKEVGRLVLDTKLHFEGNADESARIFFQNAIAQRDEALTAANKRAQQLALLLQIYRIPLPAELR